MLYYLDETDEHYDPDSDEYYFDRSPTIFSAILDTIEQVIDFLVMKGNTNSCGLLTSGSSDIIVVLKKGIQMCFNYFRFVCRIFSNKYVVHSESFQCSCSFFMKMFQ